ncbi:hypothetical protein A2348_00480 [Candidatus Uhrbacteria bacterium RIFOXYB12_FULL_58_10]|uniref:Uncharacterized protein n=1 Tax=Candidatus Uhrbacteria bacterium RIFOXYB2_FULL_57_15 TaxID=1802422 RepID=A0A1F7W6D4_9BACT|nr:MAG: hypothetical protein A2348_00480 [Candidatus Uhrbacteria bacterium RIFOXYB12_FULL_58_10]OGL98385.1 MAG: hypothetical protein A2304_01670 [Candidatus Uhrbacteria bacterium RIFOXYB2_FULL_57_15]OGM00161.1 MAG: hypothetical protein A2501_01285 [Candidatus Uhrbacteria bacterium RIFOXYC12_FULL_57_11]
MHTWQERISRVGFFTSAISYAAFWLADIMRPGFVARYLSVHLFLLAAVVFGAWWALCVREYRDWPFPQYVIAALFGLLLAALAWNVGAGFESYRLLAVVAAAMGPALVLSLVRSI